MRSDAEDIDQDGRTGRSDKPAQRQLALEHLIRRSHYI
jgi:hypothetical protein